MDIKFLIDTFNFEHKEVQNTENFLKALHNLLQSSNKVFFENVEINKIKSIQNYLASLLFSENFKSDLYLILSSSYIYLTAFLSANPADFIIQLLSNSTNKQKLKIINDCGKENFSYSNLVLISGILNVNPLWLYKNEVDPHSSSISTANKKNLVINSVKDLPNSLFIQLWFYIKSYCLSSQHLSLANQCLLNWLKLFEKFLKNNKDVFEGAIANLENEECRCILCSEEYLKNLFQINFSRNSGEIIEVIYFCCENYGKDIIYQCFKIVLSCHELCACGHSKSTMQQLLDASSEFKSRTSLLHLRVALELINPIDMILGHPNLLCELTESLKTNSLAIISTPVYKQFLLKLNGEDWWRFFAPVLYLCLNTKHESTWTNFRNFWLPTTLKLRQDLIQDILILCQKSNRSLQCSINILKMCRSSNLFLEIEEIFKSEIACKNEIQQARKVDDDFLFSGLGLNINYLNNFEKTTHNYFKQFQILVLGFSWSEDVEIRTDINSENTNLKAIIFKALLSCDENIRADAFSLICSTHRTALPLSYVEINLIQSFIQNNSNIDSQSFRQNILKSFVNLMERIRDSIYKIVKTEKVTVKNVTDFKNSIDFKGGNMPKVIAMGEFLIWFVNFFHEQLNPLSNYSRICTVLNLYKILLDVFNEKNSEKWKNYEFVRQLISSFSTDDDFRIYDNMTRVDTLDSLLNCCTNGMGDVKDIATSIILKYLKYEEKSSSSDLTSGKDNTKLPVHEILFATSCAHFEVSNPESSQLKRWFQTGLQLIDSPKLGEMESGAALIFVLTEILPSDKLFSIIISFDHTLCETIEQDYVNFANYFLNFLFNKIKQDFIVAENNILMASYHVPISGTVLTLTRCLVEAQVLTSIENDFLYSMLAEISNFYSKMVDFVLRTFNMSCIDENNPSFEEIDDSINLVVQKCKNLEISGDCHSVNEIVNLRKKDLEISGENKFSGDEEDVLDYNLSHDSQFVLSFCWHILKTCCQSSAQLIRQFGHLISTNTIETFLSDVVIKILCETRHKGAMEAAQRALAIITGYVFQTDSVSSELNNLIFKHLDVHSDEVISSRKKLASTTRRGAGLSMLFSAILSNLPDRMSHIFNNIVNKLIKSSQKDFDSNLCSIENIVTDDYASLSLHILRSIVSSSKNLNADLLSSLSLLCVENFNSNQWAIRNGALQLFGAIFPKLLGQKKVREEADFINSITMTEFTTKNPELMDKILFQLQKCNQSVPVSNLNKDSVVKDMSVLSNEYRFQNVFSLVPILNLLARLNPGPRKEKNEKVQKILEKLMEILFYLISSPVYTTRKLSSSIIVNLSDNSDILKKFGKTITILENCENLNLTNGCLLIIQSILCNEKFKFQIAKVKGAEETVHHHHRKKEIINGEVCTTFVRLEKILESIIHKSSNFMNRSLALEIIFKLNFDVKLPFQLNYLNDIENKCHFNPGASVYLRKLIRNTLEKGEIDFDNALSSSNQDIWEESVLYFTEVYTEAVCNNHNLIENTNLEYLQNCLAKYVMRDENVDFSKIKFRKCLNLLNLSFEFKCFINISVKFCAKFSTYVKELSTGEMIIGDYVVFIAFFLKSMLKNEDLIARSNTEKDCLSLIEIWSSCLLNMSKPNVNEDLRLFAANALKIVFPFVLQNSMFIENFRNMFYCLLNLLSDEDSHIRKKVSVVVISFNNCSINPFLALKCFVAYLFCRIVKDENIFWLSLAWDLCFYHSLRWLNEGKHELKHLFENTTYNPFWEHHLFSQMLNNVIINSYEITKIVVSLKYRNELLQFFEEKNDFIVQLDRKINQDKNNCTFKASKIQRNVDVENFLLSDGKTFITYFMRLFEIK